MPRKQGPRLHLKLSNFEHPKSNVLEALDAHPLTHALHILLPVACSSSVPSTASTNAMQQQQQQHQQEDNSGSFLSLSKAPPGSVNEGKASTSTRQQRPHLHLHSSSPELEASAFVPPGQHCWLVKSRLGDLVKDLISKQLFKSAQNHLENPSSAPPTPTSGSRPPGAPHTASAPPPSSSPALAQGQATSAGASHPTTTFQAVALGPELGSSGGLAITPDGTLHMAVGQEAYQRLGLLGRRCTVTPGETRYLVEVPLASKRLKPGAHQYDKVVEALNTRLGPATMLCCYSPPSDDTLQPHTLTNQQQQQPSLQPPLPSAIGCSAVPLRLRSHMVEPLAVPLLSRQLLTSALPASTTATAYATASGAMQLQPQQPECQEAGGQQLLHETVWGVLDWLGGVACGFGPEACDELLPRQLLSSCLPDACLLSHTWQGMLCKEQVRFAVAAAQRLVASSALPWAAIALWGFADSPVGWRGMERGAWESMGGDGCSTAESSALLLLLPGGDWALLKFLGSNEVAVAAGQ